MNPSIGLVEPTGPVLGLGLGSNDFIQIQGNRKNKTIIKKTTQKVIEKLVSLHLFSCLQACLLIHLLTAIHLIVN